MKIISWNVNGIRAVLKKNFIEFVSTEKPDILCIQETKAHPDQVDELLHDYEHHFWNSADKKGYSGTAIFSKIKPITVTYGGNINEGDTLTSSYIFTIVTDEHGEPLMDVVGALLYNNELIAKGLSNEHGELVIDFEGISDNSSIDLYLNKAQYYQKKIDLNYDSDDGEGAPSIDYQIVSTDSSYLYTFVSSESDYNWIEINEIGTNLNLTDDSVIPDVDLGFEFNYYGKPYTKLTVCSNGWVSFAGNYTVSRNSNGYMQIVAGSGSLSNSAGFYFDGAISGRRMYRDLPGGVSVQPWHKTIQISYHRCPDPAKKGRINTPVAG